MSKNTSKRSGVGFSTVVTIVFIVMKMTGQINWSWWWVLSPMWITIAFYILLLILIVLIKAFIDLKK